jgi:type IV pilus assembly protein PilV
LLVNRGKQSGQHGVGLVEVLVAMLVLSVGLLGLAGLQVRTLRNSQSSLERGVAVVESHAIADAMRSDLINAVENDAYELDHTDTPPTGTTFAETVLRTWRNNLVNSLGTGATGSVACNGGLCDIEVMWNDERGSGGSATQTVTTQVQL